MIKLFDIDNGVVIPTIHCKMIGWLKRIQDEFPENALTIYAYLHYQTCMNEIENPYFNLPADIKEENIIADLGITFSLEHDAIQAALRKLTEHYDTPTTRAYRGVSTMLDNMSFYMETAKITAGRDGNISALTQLAKNFDDIRQSFKGVAKDLQEEQQTQVRGNQNLAYDTE